MTSLTWSVTLLQFWWLSLPFYAALLLAIVVALGLWTLLPKGPGKKAFPIAVFVGLFGYNAILPEVTVAIESYRIQRNNWIAAFCNEFTAHAGRFASPPLVIDGILDTTDYDSLITRRAHDKMDELQQAAGGGSFSMDMGQVRHHAITGVIPGGTFDQNAATVLTKKGFSFVEFEMLPTGKGDYSNSGSLMTNGWAGPRYRRYYLVPGDSSGCTMGKPRVGPQSPAMSQTEMETWKKSALPVFPKLENDYCLAQEIGDKPLSHVRVAAAESVERVRWNMKWKDLEIPMWSRLRFDSVRVTQLPGAKVTEHRLAFEHDGRFCYSVPAIANFLDKRVAPDPRRAFLAGKAWYQGSAVQEFYDQFDKRSAVAASAAPGPIDTGSGVLRYVFQDESVSNAASTTAQQKAALDETELHVISVYEGDTVNVTIRRTRKPVALILSAHSRTSWNIRLGAGVRLEQVYAFDGQSAAQRLPKVEGLDGGIPVILGPYVSHVTTRGGALEVAARVGDVTGKFPKSIQSRYRGESFTIE